MTRLHRLLVNGIEQQVSVPDDVTLLDVLRDTLGLRGSRFGCGEGACGACTVLVNGNARTACDITVDAVSGASITTIEGLSGDDKLHPVQQAFLELQAGQCGYCLSGIIMRTAGLLESNPNATGADVVSALDHHLCRCGAQARILKAVTRAAGGDLDTRRSTAIRQQRYRSSQLGRLSHSKIQRSTGRGGRDHGRPGHAQFGCRGSSARTDNCGNCNCGGSRNGRACSGLAPHARQATGGDHTSIGVAPEKAFPS